MGFAYIFVRRNAAVLHAGHVGWGFQFANGHYFCGATENPRGLPMVLLGGDNGWWGREVQLEDDMLHEMRIRGFNQYKCQDIIKANPDNGYKTALLTKTWGYAALGNNCLDHTYAVLYAYGVKNLPLKQLHPAPNDWFDDWKGSNGVTYQL